MRRLRPANIAVVAILGVLAGAACGGRTAFWERHGASSSNGAGGAGNGEGGTTGTAGTGGTGARKGQDGAPDEGGSDEGGTSCRAAHPAAMVRMPEGYGIDRTEVTTCQYLAWLTTKPSTGEQDSWCQWNTDFTPTCEWPSGKVNHPVVCVDWCDAYAYCKGVGKRLCGKIGGGPNDYNDFEDAAKSQWYNACSSGGLNEYPYGDTYDAHICNGFDQGLLETTEVGSMARCQSVVSGYTGVYDLSGNAWEWEDACKVSLGSEDYCPLRGGSFRNRDFLLCNRDYGASRELKSNFIGFRCCAD